MQGYLESSKQRIKKAKGISQPQKDVEELETRSVKQELDYRKPDVARDILQQVGRVARVKQELLDKIQGKSRSQVASTVNSS